MGIESKAHAEAMHKKVLADLKAGKIRCWGLNNKPCKKKLTTLKQADVMLCSSCSAKQRKSRK